MRFGLERIQRLVSLLGMPQHRFASIGDVEILASGEVDRAQAKSRMDAHRAKLRAEVERAERKLANDGFVSNAPEDVVEAEREKLAAYRSELEELEG